jgi:hypothetical protein
MPEILKGLDECLANLNREIKGIEDATIGGLLAAGLIIQRDAQKHVPVEHGFLRASAFTRKAIGSTDQKPGVEVGFSAAYALFVHENLEQKWKGKPRLSGLGVYWGPAGEPQFLTHAIERNNEAILDAIKSRVKK